MYALIEHNDFYKENIKTLKTLNITPITLFNITLNTKDQIKTQINQIQSKITQIKPEFTAINIKIEKPDSSNTGTINSLKQQFDIIIGLGGLNKTNRFFLEQTKIDFLLDPQSSTFLPKKDFIHHFNSGINHILCKIAKEKNISFIFSLNFTSDAKKIIAKEIGRINQNLKFARKYKIPSLINFIIQNPNQIKTQKEITQILSLFDLSSQQRKESVQILEKKTNINKFAKSKQNITKGIKIIH